MHGDVFAVSSDFHIDVCNDNVFSLTAKNVPSPLCLNLYMSRAIDGFAPSTDSAAPSIDPSMAQQSVDV